jgi:hypothetical protein
MNNWYLLPGMGATASMYNELRHRLDFGIRFIDWPRYRGENTYAAVARRIVDENDIRDGDVIGGSSLGGMIALEMSNIIRPKAVILLGSAMNKSEVQGLLALLSPLAAITPISFVQAVAGKQKNLVNAMFSDADTEFIRSMCSNLLTWPGYSGRTTNIYRLHGKKDHVIPCPSEGASVVEGAGHLLSMTHASETAAFLEKVKQEITSHASK